MANIYRVLYHLKLFKHNTSFPLNSKSRLEGANCWCWLDKRRSHGEKTWQVPPLWKTDPKDESAAFANKSIHALSLRNYRCTYTATES